MGRFKSFLNVLNVRQLNRRIKHSLKVRKGVRHPLQIAFASNKYRLVHLGTEYGGWTFVDEGGLDNTTIISAGLGEDASFDVAFAGRYGANIIIVDPTPRAVKHFEKICERFGKPDTVPFGETGSQDPEAYNLSNVQPSQLRLVEKALWNKPGTIKFFEPKDKEHVSHSIHNYQNEYRDDTDAIEVPAATIFDVMNAFDVSCEDVGLVKLDIEGAEIEVLEDMLSKGFLPKQILVEFDELNVPSKRGYDRVSKIDKQLKECGYSLIGSDGKADFLYFKGN